MNILYVGSPQLFKEGASSIHVARMCEAFAELNHNVELILPCLLYTSPSPRDRG